MKRGRHERLVLVTCGSRGEGRKIAKAVVEGGLAACVNIIDTPAESVYRWKGKVERAKEWLLVMKTTTGRLKKLEAQVKWLHSYDLPEFLVVKVEGGSGEYLEWLAESTARGRKSV